MPTSGGFCDVGVEFKVLTRLGLALRTDSEHGKPCRLSVHCPTLSGNVVNLYDIERASLLTQDGKESSVMQKARSTPGSGRSP